MAKILIIGCTDITRVLVPIICANRGMADEICIASKDKAECDELKLKYKNSSVRIVTAGVDVTVEEKALLMMRIFGPTLIINLAPSYLNKHIMGIALKIGASYIDMNYYTDESGRKCLVDEQFDFASDFYDKGKICVTGCSFNAAAFVCLARLALKKKLVGDITGIDIIDLNNDEDDSKVVPSIVDFERLSGNAEFLDDGEKVEVPALSVTTTLNLPDKDPKKMYLFSSLAIDAYQRGMPEVKNVKYFSCLNSNVANVAEILSSVGMLSKDPIKVKGVEIAPIDYLACALPKFSSSSSKSTEGSKLKGVIVTGDKDGETKSVFLSYECRYSNGPDKYEVDPDSYMNAIALLAGAQLVGTPGWDIPGVFTPGDFDPELLLFKMTDLGLRYSINENMTPLELN